MRAKEVDLDDNVSEKLQDASLETNSPVTAWFREDESSVTNLLLRFVVLLFLVSVYPGFVIILCFYVALVPLCSISREQEAYHENGKIENKTQDRRRREEKMMRKIKKRKIMRCCEIRNDTSEIPNGYCYSRRNNQYSTDKNLNLSYDRYNNNKVSVARDMEEDELLVCSKATSNKLKLPLKLDKGKLSGNNLLGQNYSKRVTQSSWTLIKESNQSNSRLSMLEEIFGNLKGDNAVTVRKKNIENYNSQTDFFNLPENSFHRKTYIGEFTINDFDSGFLNISYIVNEMPPSNEGNKSSDIPNKRWGWGCYKMLLKAVNNRLSIRSTTKNDFLKDTNENFSTFIGNCNRLAFAIRSSSVDNYHKISHIHTSKAGRSTQINNRKNSKMQKSERNMGNDRIQGPVNINDLSGNCFPNNIFNGDGLLQEENDKKDESNEKRGNSCKYPIADDHKLSKIRDLTADVFQSSCKLLLVRG